MTTGAAAADDTPAAATALGVLIAGELLTVKKQ